MNKHTVLSDSFYGMSEPHMAKSANCARKDKYMYETVDLW